LSLNATGACSADDQKELSDPNVIGKKAGDCGKQSYNIITGVFNHVKFNSCLTASAGISSGCSECYAVSGEYGAKNCKAECILGWCKQGCLDCVKPAEGALDMCTGFTSAPAKPCLYSKAAGECSADDQKALSDPNVIGKKAGDCGKQSYNIFTGEFNHDKFNSCLTASAGISSGCSECYAVSGEYGAKNCKAECILGWCKQGCLDCVKPAEGALDTCTGFTSAPAKPCLYSNAPGACSADDQKALLDPNVIGKKAGDCGKQSYNIITGEFNHDKFNSCLTASAGISSGCSECYAVSGEFGAKHCKAECILGWCKQGCLDCVKPAEGALDTCTGFSSAPAKPCSSADAAELFV
jgi:hypothetical protein